MLNVGAAGPFAGGRSVHWRINVKGGDSMRYRATLSTALLTAAAVLSQVGPSSAWPGFADLAAANDDLIVQVGARGGMGGGGGMAGMGGGMAGMGGGMAMAGMGGGGGMGAKGMGGAGAKGMGGAGAKGKGAKGKGAKGKGGAGAKGMGGAGAAGGMGGAVNVNVHGTTVRPWVRRPYFGTVVGGVALGTVIAATTAPVAPAPNLCWVWTSSAQTQGYWDYCEPPQ